MQLTLEDVRRDFDAAAAAAARGERVTVTRDGKPFLQLVAVGEQEGIFERARRVQRELGLDGARITLPPNFDDPAFSRKVLGLDD